MRYKELKIDGKVLTSQSKIDSALESNGFYWVVDSEIENAVLEITKNTLIWHNGTFYSGKWHYGIFKDGIFNGVWINGIFENGIFRGKCESGIRNNQ